jgi:multiple sugar transport system substrate-binding protein
VIHRHVLTTLVVLTSGTAALADCGIAAGSVRILSNDFEALHVVADAAADCASTTVTVTSNKTAEHATLQVPALTTNPATYSVAMVANDSIVPLLNEGLIRPLDDLVAKFGTDLAPTQLIKIDGKVMAIAFMANAQHLYFRKDVLDKVGLAVPKTYEEVLAAAEAIRAAGIAPAPLAANFKPGWNLAAEFVNMYTGFGGEFFVAGTAELAISNQQAIDALNMMKALSGYMSPDYMTYDTNAMKPLWDASAAVLLNGWGSRAAGMIDPTQTTPDIAANTGFASAPTVGGGTIPAATLWWDGFVIAKNISDEDAEASFRAMIHGASPQTAKDHAAAAAWLMPGYEPTPAAVGVIDTIAAGAKPYPMAPFMGVLHSALGDNLAEFMQGQESAEQALADVTTAYITAATEAGFLK